MKKFVFYLAVLGASLVFTRCTKDSSSADIELSYSFSATNMAASLGSTGTASGSMVTPLSNGSITWTSATVNIFKIEFSAKKEGKTISADSKNLYALNALKPDSLAGKVGISSGVYENVEFKVTMNSSTTIPPFVLQGTYTESSGTKIPVVVQLTDAQSFSLAVPRVELQSGKYVAKVTLEMNNLVKGLTASDFGQTTRTGSSNAIVVNSTTNRALYEKLTLRAATVSSVTVNKQ